MKRITRAALAAVALSSGLWMFGSTPASAHGTCVTTAWVPAPSLLSVAYGGQFDCTDSHPDIYVYLCLQRSPSLTLQNWSDVHCGAQGHAANANHVHAYNLVFEPCVGYYRTWAWGHNANNSHSDVDISQPVACASSSTS